MAEGAELPAFAGKSQEILVTAIFTTHPGKSHMEVTEIQIFIDYCHDVGAPETQARWIHIVPYPFQLFKVIFNAFVICACFRIALLVNIKIICR